jgi:hypothetical protein
MPHVADTDYLHDSNAASATKMPVADLILTVRSVQGGIALQRLNAQGNHSTREQVVTFMMRVHHICLYWPTALKALCIADPRPTRSTETCRGKGASIV